eukprot:117833_1
MTSRSKLRSTSTSCNASEIQPIVQIEESKDKSSDNKSIAIPNNLLWLDRCILYFPMCTSFKPCKHSNTDDNNKIKQGSRNKYLIGLIITISILLCVLKLIESIENFFNDDLIYFYLNDLLLDICVIAFKLFSLHYFYSFTFPWHNNIKFTYIKNNNENKHMKTWPQKLSKIMIIFMTIIYIPFIVLNAYFGHTETSLLHKNAWGSVVTDLIFAYFWWFPITFSFTVHTVLCAKYEYYLSQIIYCIEAIHDQREDINITLKQVILDYEALHELFKNEYGSSLVNAMFSFLLGTILYFWGFFFHAEIQKEYDVSIEYIITNGLYGVIGSILMIIMYTVPANLLNKSCKKIEKKLWHIHNDEWKFSMHFLDFMKKYCIGVRIGKFVITYKSVIAFFVVFGVTKYITFSIRSASK